MHLNLFLLGFAIWSKKNISGGKKLVNKNAIKPVFIGFYHLAGLGENLAVFHNFTKKPAGKMAVFANFPAVWTKNYLATLIEVKNFLV